MLRNGELLKSVHLQKRLSSSMFFLYPATLLSGLTLQGGVGQPFTGSLTAMAQKEEDDTTDASTGSRLAAPTGGFFDGVGNFSGVQLNDTPIDAVVQSVNLQLTREGAAMEYGMGSAAAQGARWGQLSPGGSIEILFRSLAEYALFKSEAQRTVSWLMRDPQGNAYAVTLPATCLMNGSPAASGPNQTVRSTITLEGAQDLSSHAIQIDRLAAAA